MFTNQQDLLNIKSASIWATEFLGKNVTTSNISYLIQYGRIRKFGDNGNTLISRKELRQYYKSYNGYREISWREQLGRDLNWALSFKQYKEAETTKHVHRLHSYKGKFILQQVEIFLRKYFKKGDTILDTFSGSGTTFGETNVSGMNSRDIDLSLSNAVIQT